MTSENHKINRRDMFKIGGAVVGSITAAGMVSSADARMRRPLSFIIQNATVLTMDEKQGAGGDNHFGQIDNCDVYVLDGKIEEVGKNLAVLSTVEVIDGTDQIVLPGFVDGHRHLWQTAMRNRQEIFGFGNYGPQGINKYSPSYSAHDMEVSAYMGGLEALNAGVTSAVDFCHNSITPEHSEAALRGNQRSGIGGYFCYSFAGVANHGPGDTVDMANRRPAPDGTWRIDHAKSMKDKYFSDKDANLKFGICTSSYEYFGKFAPDRVIAEMNSIHYINPDLISIHIHNHGKDFRLVPMMVENELLNDKVLLAHANGVTLDEMHMIKPLGVSLCNTPESEAPYGEMPSFGNGEAAGLDISIGADSVIFNGGDMFSAMRMTLQFTRYGQAPAWDNDKSSHITHPMSILKAATIDGARAMGIDGKVGSLEKGKQADIIMIDTNGPHFQPMTFPLAAVLFNANINDIKNVWVQGKAKKRDGKLLAADFDDAKKELDLVTDGIVNKAESITLV